jgi:hypothetical protein
VAFQHVDHAQHAVHRRSDFVTHGGEKLRLRGIVGRSPVQRAARDLAMRETLVSTLASERCDLPRGREVARSDP